jgi:hypothetical protein
VARGINRTLQSAQNAASRSSALQRHGPTRLFDLSQQSPQAMSRHTLGRPGSHLGSMSAKSRHTLGRPGSHLGSMSDTSFLAC